MYFITFQYNVPDLALYVVTLDDLFSTARGILSSTKCASLWLGGTAQSVASGPGCSRDRFVQGLTSRPADSTNCEAFRHAVLCCPAQCRALPPHSSSACHLRFRPSSTVITPGPGVVNEKTLKCVLYTPILLSPATPSDLVPAPRRDHETPSHYLSSFETSAIAPNNEQRERPPSLPPTHTRLTQTHKFSNQDHVCE